MKTTTINYAELINRDIINTIKSVDNSIIRISLNLVKIKSEKLYFGLGFDKMSQYLKNLIQATKKDRSSIYKWLQMGEVYVKYREKLERAGFNTMDSMTKLPFLERALKNNPQKEVYDNIVKMSQREFANYARSIVEINVDISESTDGMIREVEENKDHIFFYREKEAVIVRNIFGKRSLKNLLTLIRMAFNVIARKDFVVTVSLRNYNEYRKFIPIARKAKENLQELMDKNPGNYDLLRITNSQRLLK